MKHYQSGFGRHEDIHWLLFGNSKDERIWTSMRDTHARQRVRPWSGTGLTGIVENTHALAFSGWRRRDVLYTCIYTQERSVLGQTGHELFISWRSVATMFEILMTYTDCCSGKNCNDIFGPALSPRRMDLRTQTWDGDLVSTWNKQFYFVASVASIHMSIMTFHNCTISMVFSTIRWPHVSSQRRRDLRLFVTRGRSERLVKAHNLHQ